MYADPDPVAFHGLLADVEMICPAACNMVSEQICHFVAVIGVNGFHRTAAFRFYEFFGGTLHHIGELF